MTQTRIHKVFNPFKTYLPRWISNPIRSCFTAFLTPALFSWRTGHFLSCFKMAAVSKHGDPLPWYTYPCIDFLKNRSYEDKAVLELGGGQSTLWWAQRAKHVVTFEGDIGWYDNLKAKVPSNVELYLVSMEDSSSCVEEINKALSVMPDALFDVIVIDGLYRYEMIGIAHRTMTETGLIICDNAEGYGFYEGFKDRELSRVDFFGNVPGVVLPHCTSIFFRAGSFIFSPKHPIPVIANER